MKRCHCGELVEDHVRFHWLAEGPDVGHYVESPHVTAVKAVDEGRDVGHRGIEIPPAPPVKQRPKGTEEELVLRPSIGLLRDLGWGVWQLEQNRKGESARQTPGLADIFAAGFGVTAWLECKRWGEKQNPNQVVFEEEVLANGGIYLLIYDPVVQIIPWHRAVIARQETR